jgi:hypothetical protein
LIIYQTSRPDFVAVLGILSRSEIEDMSKRSTALRERRKAKNVDQSFIEQFSGLGEEYVGTITPSPKEKIGFDGIDVLDLAAQEQLIKRIKEKAAKLRGARKAEIERRCMLLDPPLTPGVLEHMGFFQGAIQTIRPLNDGAWEVLKPRLLSQREDAERRKKERISHTQVIQEQMDNYPNVQMQDQRRDDDEMSDTSEVSVSSIISVTDSIFSILSSSSMSSAAGPEAAGERLVQLLLSDEDIRPLCVEGVNTLAIERFERNLRRLLSTFAAELKKEASNQQERHAAHFVRFRARNSAHIICSRLSPKSRSRAVREPTFQADGQSDPSDSDQSEDDVDDMQHLEDFIKSSRALETLRDTLRAFVSPQVAPAEPDLSSSSDLDQLGAKECAASIADFPISLSHFGKINAMWNLSMPFRGGIYSLWKSEPPTAGKTRIEWKCVSVSKYRRSGS